MTDKELRRLSRSELLEMLIAQTEENSQLKIRLEQAEAQLRDRRIEIDKAGSLAEAALSLNGVFQAAEAAAQAEGRTAMEAAEKKAAAELAELRSKSDEKAKEDALELASDTENRKAAMRARADARLEKAAALIVERVVNG